MKRTRGHLRILVGVALLLALGHHPVDAQSTDDASAAHTDPPVTLLPHDPSARWWLSGQINIIEQAHGAFTSPYAGPNSLRGEAEHAVSRVLTLYTGAQLGRGWEVTLDIESAGGDGLSDARGLAGLTYLDM